MGEVINGGFGDDDDKKKKAKAKASALIGQSKPARKPRAKPQPVGPGVVIQVSASGQAQAAGRDIHNHTYAKPPRQPRVKVVPGEGVINEDQKVALAALRDEWMTLHAAIKKKPLSHAAAWSAINKSARARSYHLIRQEHYGLALAFIRKQMGILRGMASAPAKDKTWRASRISGIKLRCKNQLGNPDLYKPYIRKNFDASSLADLSSDDLQRTYAYVMNKKPVA